MPDQTEQLLALLPRAGTPSGHVPKVQPDGSVAWEAEAGGGAGAGALLHVVFPFDHTQHAELPGGVPVTGWTPAPGDVFLGAWISIPTAFNGTTPKADLLFGSAATDGYFSQGPGLVDLTIADTEFFPGYVLVWSGNGIGAGQSLLTAQVPPGGIDHAVLVASQTGVKGGADPGSTAGAGALHMLVLPA